jgi:aconitate hydratase
LQDATGTLVQLELEAMGLKKAKTESGSICGSQLHCKLILKMPMTICFTFGCTKFGLWYSRPGNGVSHPVHMERLENQEKHS